jgi:hypothetical protein
MSRENSGLMSNASLSSEFDPDLRGLSKEERLARRKHRHEEHKNLLKKSIHWNYEDGHFMDEVDFWRRQIEELSFDEHKRPPEKVVPDGCHLLDEHKHWQQKVDSISMPTPGGSSIINHFPKKGSTPEEEMEYWRAKMEQYCVPTDELVARNHGPEEQHTMRRHFWSIRQDLDHNTWEEILTKREGAGRRMSFGRTQRKVSQSIERRGRYGRRSLSSQPSSNALGLASSLKRASTTSSTRSGPSRKSTSDKRATISEMPAEVRTTKDLDGQGGDQQLDPADSKDQASKRPSKAEDGSDGASVSAVATSNTVAAKASLDEYQAVDSTIDMIAVSSETDTLRSGTIVVHSAKGLRNADTFGHSDPYVKVRVGTVGASWEDKNRMGRRSRSTSEEPDEDDRRSKTVSNTGNPVWNFKMPFEIPPGHSSETWEAHFKVFDHDYSSDDFLGELALPFASLFDHWGFLQEYTLANLGNEGPTGSLGSITIMTCEKSSEDEQTSKPQDEQD